MITAPYYPIVYIRGYAGSQAEVEDTVADPYMGFNVGATKTRQRWTGDIIRHIFESPLVRLMKDYNYNDVYMEGQEVYDHKRLPAKSVWIYRYYEPVSKALGTGFRPEMEDYAKGLSDFLARLRHAYTGDNNQAKKNFKVILVAHSMGGLVARCYLQNISKNYKPCRYQDDPGAAPVKESNSVTVDKVFTYATPHGGIDLRLIGNIPRFLQFNNIENFNEKRMREYLAITDKNLPVTSLNNAFDHRRFFSLVGTNARDYAVANGLARSAVGPLSDGLVQIKNASADKTPRAYVHRSHSGHYGIVNSEEGYQNMVRFLFGDMKVDGLLMIDDITLPRFAQRALDKGKKVRASYYVECITRVRGADWDLHRRLTEENSALHCVYDKHIRGGKPAYLFSSFLSKQAIVSRSSKSMCFAMDLRIQVPKYEIDGREKRSAFIREGYIFRDKLNFKVMSDEKGIRLYTAWDSQAPNEANRRADIVAEDDHWHWSEKITTPKDPKLTATFKLTGRDWA